MTFSFRCRSCGETHTGMPSFGAWDACFHDAQRSHIGPFFGWLSTRLPAYPDPLNLKTRVYLLDDGLRPSIELEPTDHPPARFRCRAHRLRHWLVATA